MISELSYSLLRSNRKTSSGKHHLFILCYLHGRQGVSVFLTFYFCFVVNFFIKSSFNLCTVLCNYLLAKNFSSTYTMEKYGPKSVSWSFLHDCTWSHGLWDINVQTDHLNTSVITMQTCDCVVSLSMNPYHYIVS